MYIPLEEVARATLDALDRRWYELANIVQYHLYCDGSYTLPAFAASRKPEITQKTRWPSVITTQYTPRMQIEHIVGVAAGPLVESEMHQHGLKVQPVETLEASAVHQAVKWALRQTHPVTRFFDCDGAGFPAAGLAIPSAETRAIASATRALVHFAESHGVNITFTHVHSHKGHGLNELADTVAKA